VRLSRIPARTSAVFDDPNLVSHGGLVPVMALAERAGLPELLEEHARPGGECGVNAPLKVGCLVAGMAAGADSIDDMGLLRHGAIDTLFGGVRAPSTLGSHLRCYTWGNVLQIEKTGRELLARLSRQAPLLPGADVLAFIDIDSTQKRVYGHSKQGARFGRTKIQGKSAQAIGTARACGGTGTIIVRMDSAYYAAAVIAAVRRSGARFSVTAPVSAAIRAAIAAIPEEAWQAIEYPQAIWDDQLGCWVSDAEVAQTPYAAFTSNKELHVTARLIVRRVRDKVTAAPGQGELFPAWRYHAVFTDSPYELVQAEQQHRGHAIIEQLLADLSDGPLAHLPSGKFTANAAWLATAAIAHNLTRAAGTLAGRRHARARAATIRRDLIAVAARTARHGRDRLTLHLPQGWHREHEWLNLWEAACGPPAHAA
jgi:DDE family transposase